MSETGDQRRRVLVSVVSGVPPLRLRLLLPLAVCVGLWRMSRSSNTKRMLQELICTSFARMCCSRQRRLPWLRAPSVVGTEATGGNV